MSDGQEERYTAAAEYGAALQRMAFAAEANAEPAGSVAGYARRPLAQLGGV